MTEKSDNPAVPPPQPALRKLFAPGTILADRYRVISVVGQGGMGVVYKAQHIHMEREMAIKTLAQEMSPDSEPFRRFKQEAKVIATLNHPNIVDIHDFAIDGNQAYLVMDYLDGIHIERAIDEFGPMGLDHFVHIFSQACEALQYAHNKGIIHRDLKGGNMMIVTEEDRRDILKLVDFGIAKLLEDDVEEDLILTRAGKIVGSPLFMSPEQCLGHEFDHRADIYSLGIVMFRSLTGELPLVGENAMKTLHKQITELPPPFSEANPDIFVPQSLESVVRKALAKQPEERQQNMLELLEDLKEALRTAELSTATKVDQEQVPVLEPVAAVPMAAGQEQVETPEPVTPGATLPQGGTTENEMATLPPSQPSHDSGDWKSLTAPGLTAVPRPPDMPLPANPSLPAGVSSNAFAARWRSSSQPMQIQRPGSQPVVNAQQGANALPGANAQQGSNVPLASALKGSGTYQGYVGGARPPAAPTPRTKVNPALFKWGQFEAPPEGLPPIPPAQAFKQQYSHGAPRGTGHSMPAQAKDPGPGSMKDQLDQIIRRSAAQAKIDRIIEEQDQQAAEKLAASRRNMPTYQPSSSRSRPSSSSSSKSGQKEENFSEGVSGNPARSKPPRFNSAPVIDEFFLDKLVDKVMHPMRKLFEKKEESYVQEVNSSYQEATAPPVTKIAFVVTPIVVVVFLAWQFWPRSVTADQAYGRVSHVYKSADGQVQFRLTGTDSCELQVQDRRMSTNCRFYLNDWREAVELSLGYPFQNQYWLYETRDGIADDAKNSFYGAYSPESELTEKMEVIGKYAAACYEKNGRYPDSATTIVVEDVNLKYKNPFTKDPEVPSFRSITIGSGEDADADADNRKRRKFFKRIFEGGSWEDAPEAHPGQIRCCSVTFKNKDGDSQGFVAQIIGHNSKPMRGFSSGTSYVYALENGKEHKGSSSESESPQFPFTGKSGQPDVVWFFIDKPDADLVSVLKHGATYAFGFLAVIVLLLVLSSKNIMRNLMRP